METTKPEEGAGELEQPRLVVDPPPYRPSPVLRGPKRLLIAVEGVRAAGEPLAHYALRYRRHS